MEGGDFFKNLFGFTLFIGVVLAFFFCGKLWAKDCFSKAGSTDKTSLLFWSFILGGVVGALGGLSNVDHSAKAQGFAIWVICFLAAWIGHNFGLDESKQNKK